MEPVSVLLVNHSSILPPVLAQALQENDELVVIGRVSGGSETAMGMGFQPFEPRLPGVLTPAHFLLSCLTWHLWSPRLALRGRV